MSNYAKQYHTLKNKNESYSTTACKLFLASATLITVVRSHDSDILVATI